MFGLSLASNWRGSLVATAGREQDGNYYIALHRSAGSHWVMETNSVMRSGYVGSLTAYVTSIFGWEIQMADVMPNVVATKNNRMPVHVMASGIRLRTSLFFGNTIDDLGNTIAEMLLDAFYCNSIGIRSCSRPRFLFDPYFYFATSSFFPDPVDDFLPPPPIDNAAMLYDPEKNLYSTFSSPLPFFPYRAMAGTWHWQI